MYVKPTQLSFLIQGRKNKKCMCEKLRSLYRKVSTKWQKILEFMPGWVWSVEKKKLKCLV